MSTATDDSRSPASRTVSDPPADLRRWDVRRAWRALQTLFDDPDDTAAVFEIIDALPGRSAEKAFQRFARSAVGERVLADARDLIDVLNDRDRLLAMPDGSLGRTYAEFVAREQISADGLAEASEQVERLGVELDDDRMRFFARLRDMHDLEHVVTGYGRDLHGEVALLSLSFAQLHTPGIGFIIGMVYLRGSGVERQLIRQGWSRGRRAEWMPGVDWEALLPLPLGEVRRRLRLGAPPRYEALFSNGAPAAAAG